MEDLWMKALQDRELEVLPDGGRRLWWLLVPVNQTYLYMSHYVIRNIHELEFYIRWMQRMLSREIEWRAISRLWGIPERDPCMQIEEDNLVEQPPVHSRSMVKIPYNIKMITQYIRSHDDRRSTTWICSSFPTIIYSIVYIYMKPSHCSD